ncbi:pre-rRNA processing protein Utp22 [Aulographum hederae CBS 113979]|uniref:U3 small nucleolar RNA-associated protein 22 n=1 Tax=Aulographum hederae CBS 113979 TaxID=1176131 RepID=A0A6G1H5N5_9PEZI|nr:pre-rRNA processing protein Utp22 [Aulographum hederae CBS 113979]
MKKPKTYGSGDIYTGEMFKSNVFKLQMDELLEDCAFKHGKREKEAEGVLHTLKSIIEKIPDREPLSIGDAERNLAKFSKIAVPFPNPGPPSDAQYKLQYSRPSNINVVGSYALKVASRLGSELVIDLVVKMPASLFQEKDYMNHRYFNKRAYYLACLAAGIKNSSLKDGKFILHYDLLNGNYLQPTVIVQSSSESQNGHNAKARWKIQIIPVVEDSVFATNKTMPDKNCIRPKATANEVTSLPPTPFYNASLRSDSCFSGYLRLLHDASKSCDSFKDACILGSVWLRQRGFSSEIQSGGFGNFEWAATMALLLTGGGPKGKPRLSSGYSSYQLFKAQLQFLEEVTLTKKAVNIGQEIISAPKDNQDPVLFDGERMMNILFKMSPWSYELLKQEAEATVASLGESAFDQFESTFITRADHPLLRQDCLIQLPVQTLLSSSRLDRDEESIMLACRKLFRVLKRGLSDRVSCVAVFVPQTKPWDVKKKMTGLDLSENVTIGLTYRPENSSRTVDHGPTAEEKKEAAAFRQFWGEKAELRRFKDGSILESLVWSTKESNKSIVEQIVRYVIARHFNDDLSEAMVVVGDQVSSMIPSGASTSGAFQPMMGAFTELEQDIRSLEDLPLTVRELVAASPSLSYSSLDIPGSSRSGTPPADVVLQFEGSSRWPDDLAAIQRTKIAFLLRVGDLLEEMNASRYSCQLGLENSHSEILNQAFLDIRSSSASATFRLRIHCDREQSLLSSVLDTKAAKPLPGTGPQITQSDRDAAAAALRAYKRDFLSRPAHTAACRAIATRFPAYTPTVRLLKKWFSSHLLAPHFPDELIELFATLTFTRPEPWTTPSSPSTGFFRTIAFLARWDWRQEPLVVDFAGEEDSKMTSAEVKETMMKYEAWRRIDPSMNRVAMFAASSAVSDGAMWTDGRPARVVAGRMTALARAAAAAIKEKGVEVGLHPEMLFSSALQDYDFVLRLDPSVTRKEKGDKLKAKFKNLELAAEGAGFSMKGSVDPAQSFLEGLQYTYGDAVVLFYGGRGSSVIAGLWNPAHLESRKLKVRMGYSSLPVAKGEEAEVKMNRDAILAEMARLGGDMVKKVELMK